MYRLVWLFSVCILCNLEIRVGVLKQLLLATLIWTSSSEIFVENREPYITLSGGE